MGSHKREGLDNKSSPTTLWLSSDSEAAMMRGPENPHTLLHTTDCLNSRRIYCHEKQQGREKVTKETVEKTGSSPRENKENIWVSTTFPKRKKFMQVGNTGLFPAQRSWLNLRVRKSPGLAASVCIQVPHQHKTRPPVRLAFWHG